MKLRFTFSFLIFCFNLIGQSTDVFPKTMSEGAAASNWVTDSIYCFKKNNTTGELENDFRVYNQEFDNQGNLLLEVTQIFINGTWNNFRRVENTYNLINQLQKSTIENFDLERRGWFFATRSLFIYNTNGFLLEMETQEFLSGIWQPRLRNVYTYFNNSDPDEFTQQIIVDGVWVNNFKVFNSFNTKGQITSTLFAIWDNTLRAWVNNNRTFDTFDELDRLVQSRKEIWITTENKWQISSRDLVNYGELTERQTQEFWQNFDSTWVPEMEVLLTFNENNQQIERVERQYENGSFEFFFRSQNTYDEFSNLIIVDNFLFNTGIWDLISSCEFFHTGETSSIESNQSYSISACKFENPINDRTIIKCNELEGNLTVKIMDTAGRIVYAKDHRDEFSIDKNLIDGIYFLSILSKKENQVFTHLIAWKN